MSRMVIIPFWGASEIPPDCGLLGEVPGLNVPVPVKLLATLSPSSLKPFFRDFAACRTVAV